MGRLRLLDLFCGAGGAAMGYHRAGFEVVGVDINPQPHYPFEVIQADALNFPLDGFDAYHASPPCQFASELTPPEWKGRHLNLIFPVRLRLMATGRPYIIENVEGARRELINPTLLCGSMFGLNIFRHRYFETNFLPTHHSPATCNHSFIPVVPSGEIRRLVLVSGRGMAKVEGRRRKENTKAEKAGAMGIDWMTEAELTQAIPPAYTEWLGLQLHAFLQQHQAKEGRLNSNAGG
jgi:DNA (cytosine-5)-methyltransferase 1